MTLLEMVQLLTTLLIFRMTPDANFAVLFSLCSVHHEEGGNSGTRGRELDEQHASSASSPEGKRPEEKRYGMLRSVAWQSLLS